jgi:TLD
MTAGVHHEAVSQTSLPKSCFNGESVFGALSLFLTNGLLVSQALSGSSVLSRVTADVGREFIGKLTTDWLQRKEFELLYRGTRDGMTAEAFHEKCDGKGPTLVLVAGQSEGEPVCVFGGYAGKSWEADRSVILPVDARDSFVFTVLNVFGDGIVKMPLNESSQHCWSAMSCYAGWGPVFGSGFAVVASRMSPSAEFDNQSFCEVFLEGTFGDPLGHGNKTFTGTQRFTPLEVEVWSVY